ncbi:hypothetical protein KEM56_003744 [Ascosphaera pollenicola]|nr:hypothetical protein KEM56_003744 [Ascosphaera pollenicola]
MGTSKTSRSSKQAPLRQQLPKSTFIIDNGAYTMKAGWATAVADAPAADVCVPVSNTLVRTRDKQVYTGLELAQITDWNEAAFRRPVEKGYIVNWEAERDIWEHSFFEPKTAKRAELRVADPKDTTLILTEAPNALPTLQKNTDEIIMEEWQFGGYARCLASTLNAWNDTPSIFDDPVKVDSSFPAAPADCLIVVDSGYSHTTVTPVYRGRALQRAIRRLDIGGKFLTNHLKELISLRQYHMLDETYIVNEVKEAVCFVSQDFSLDMEKTWKSNRKRRTQDYSEEAVVEYVLPDPTANRKGFVRSYDSVAAVNRRKDILAGATAPGMTSEDVLLLGNERFTVPESLFTPTDIGIKAPGIPELIMQSLSVLPAALHPAFLGNVLVVGGTSLMPGFLERLKLELRKLAPSECVIRVRQPVDPIRSAWVGANRLATNRQAMEELAITRQQYHEYGPAWAARRFQRG